MTDLTGLSDDVLAATLSLLGEQAQEITNATTLVRDEQQRRSAAPAVTLGDFGTTVLSDCVTAAPARVEQIADETVAVETAVSGG